MGVLHLVTGRAGYQHITSTDQGRFNVNMFGSGQYVLETGAQFSASFANNPTSGNSVTVKGGDILMQGRYIRTGGMNSMTMLKIQSCTQGMRRHDLIVVRYTKDSATEIEEADFRVIMGTPSATEAIDPEYTVGDITLGQATENEMPLYRVVIEGASISKLEPLFEVVYGNLIALGKKVDTHTHSASDISEGILPTTCGGTGRNSYTANRLLYASASSALAQVPQPASDHAVLQQNKTGAPYWTTFDQLLSDIGSARIATGSYTGNGKYGENNANSITCGFTPKLVVVSVEQGGNSLYRGGNAWVYGTKNGLVGIGGDSATLTWSNAGLSWYSTSANMQLNADDGKYHWVALG